MSDIFLYAVGGVATEDIVDITHLGIEKWFFHYLVPILIAYYE